MEQGTVAWLCIETPLPEERLVTNCWVWKNISNAKQPHSSRASRLTAISGRRGQAMGEVQNLGQHDAGQGRCQETGNCQFFRLSVSFIPFDTFNRKFFALTFPMIQLMIFPWILEYQRAFDQIRTGLSIAVALVCRITTLMPVRNNNAKARWHCGQCPQAATPWHTLI